MERHLEVTESFMRTSNICFFAQTPYGYKLNN